MSEQQFANVWNAIEDSPEQAQSMRLRSILMMALKARIERAEMSQTEAAASFGGTRVQISMANPLMWFESSPGHQTEIRSSGLSIK